MMCRRFPRHPRRNAGDRSIGLRNDNHLNIAIGIPAANQHHLTASRMKWIVNPSLNFVLMGSMKLF
jgi:hypothetical protein